MMNNKTGRRLIRHNIKLWPYQQVVYDAMMLPNVTKGKIIIPTAGGKGVIDLAAIKGYCELKEDPFIALKLTPRILLNKQAFFDAHQYLNVQHRKHFHFVGVSSDNIGQLGRDIEKDLIGFYEGDVLPILSTTNPEDLCRRVNRLTRQGYNVLVIGTYHSNKVIRSSGIEFDLAIYDEAHYLPTSTPDMFGLDYDDFFASTDIVAKIKFFFTATPKCTPSNYGKGMNNEDVYGPIISSYSARELIEIGSIISPLLHVVTTDPSLSGVLDVKNDNLSEMSANMTEIDRKSYNAQANLLFDAFFAHEDKVKERSALPDQIGAKMLTVVNGSEAMRGILQSKRFAELSRLHPDIKIYAISSDYGIECLGYKTDKATNRGKEKFINFLQNMTNTDRAIILHIDMIGLGLDVPLLTGVLFFRHCGLERLLQNIGRAQRLHPYDRMRIESGELTIGDWPNYIKPNYEVIITYCFENKEDFYKTHSDTIVSLRTEYDFDTSKIVVSNNLQPAHTDEDEILDEILQRTKGFTKDDAALWHHRIEDAQLIDETRRNKNLIIELIQQGDLSIIDKLGI